MGKWYLQRAGQQYGPYSQEQLVSFDAQQRLVPGDLFFDISAQIWLTLDSARQVWYKPAPPLPANPAPGKKRRNFRPLIVVLLSILVVVAAVLFFIWNKTSDNMSLGRRQHLAQQTVEETGAHIRVDKDDSAVDGLEIDVPGGAFLQKTKFKISTTEIKEHRFGHHFNPLTPLITIDNGHNFAQETMAVTIPIRLPDDSFAMAFYYDRKSGRLEGLPLLALTDDQITVATNHFSEIVVTSIKKADLDASGADTGFRPGVDDWHFVNRGSVIAPSGHCGGQSISAMWYYTERQKKAGDPHLHGFLDNNLYGCATSDFWQDDSWGYRFASVTQMKADWGSSYRELTRKMGDESDQLTFDALKYAMLLSGEPQLIEVSRTTTSLFSKSKWIGHAIIAYRIADGKIYTADPNYPGAADRFITYSGKAFKPYSSGLNAQDIKKWGTLTFPDIRYVAQSALVDYDLMNNLYNQMMAGTIGNDMFPAVSYEIATAYDPLNGEYTWKPCPDVIKIDAEQTAQAHESLRGKIVFRVSSGLDNQITSVYQDLAPVRLLQKFPVSDGFLELPISLEKDETHLGFLSEFTVENSEAYAEFRRVKILYEQPNDLNFEQDQYEAYTFLDQEYKAIANNFPRDIQYLWDFGDNTGQQKTNSPSTTHAYQEAGKYNITLRVVDKNDGTLYAETLTSVEVSDLTGKWTLTCTIEGGAIERLLRVSFGAMRRFFDQYVETTDDLDRVSLRGMTSSCSLEIITPSAGKDAFTVRLKQLPSSYIAIMPDTQPWVGELTIEGDDLAIGFLTFGKSKFMPSLVNFKGELLPSGDMRGTFDTILYSGSFIAEKNHK